MHTYSHFINGKWSQPKNNEYLNSINPTTGQVWARIAKGCKNDADSAVQTANNTFKDSWGRLSMTERADHIDNLAWALENRWEELVEVEINDNGKRISEVRGQFAGLHEWYRYFAEQGRSIIPQLQDNGIDGVCSETQFFPYGVIVAITPWNSPLMILAWKLAPALVAGNAVVVKPSELASVSTLEFAKLASESGLPDGVLNVVTGLGHEIGESLVRHPHTGKVSFTGSGTGGRKVAKACANGIVPVILELGGKSPQIVFADADMDNVLKGVVSGIFLSNGQTCVAGSRLIVHRSVKDTMVKRLVHLAGKLKPGSPTVESTQVAPLANQAHLEKVLSMIDCANKEGAVRLIGGEQLFPEDCPNGFFVAPTIFDDVKTDMQLWQEEVFGPVLAVTTFETEEEAVDLANDSKFGLAAGIWTSDSSRAKRITQQLKTGTVYINHYRSVAPGSPIGGVKQSGYGKELGPNAVKDYLQEKSVWMGSSQVADPFPEFNLIDN